MPNILIEKNSMVPMRDGVRLATDIYRLEGTMPTPVLVVRTPYTKDRLDASQSRPALNRIFHDAAHPSRLILPIIER